MLIRKPLRAVRVGRSFTLALHLQRLHRLEGIAVYPLPAA
jgi:hypothetical protein